MLSSLALFVLIPLVGVGRGDIVVVDFGLEIEKGPALV